jgi:hypothetical protein
MTTPPPPVVVQQKRGLGCFGIGCVILVVVLLLLGALIAGGVYFGYSKIDTLTSTSPAISQNFDGGDNLNQTAQQKGSDFENALHTDQPATIEYSAEELNTLIARDPDFASNQIHLVITTTGDQARIQSSLPTNLIPFGLIKDRYVNIDAQFGLGFDAATKTLKIDLHALKFQSQSVPSDQLPALQAQLEPFINTQLQRSPEAKRVLDHAESIEIRDGKLVIQTK